MAQQSDTERLKSTDKENNVSMDKASNKHTEVIEGALIIEWSTDEKRCHQQHQQQHHQQQQNSASRALVSSTATLIPRFE